MIAVLCRRISLSWLWWRFKWDLRLMPWIQDAHESQLGNELLLLPTHFLRSNMFTALLCISSMIACKISFIPQNHMRYNCAHAGALNTIHQFNVSIYTLWKRLQPEALEKKVHYFRVAVALKFTKHRARAIELELARARPRPGGKEGYNDKALTI